jgi:Pentapeptide repeats (8 copies)
MIATAIALAPPLAYGAWWLWWRLPKWQLKSLEPQIPTERRADIEDNFRKTAGQLIGGAAVLIGAGFALFQFLQQQQVAHDLLISNQVSKGFEQLASDKIAMRLGGIYALEGVMNTSEQYHRPVLEGLCAFVRENTIGKTASKDKPATDASEDKPATDVQAALTVIGRRKEGPGAVDLANVSIPGADLVRANLGGANFLGGADLRGAKLGGVNLADADLSNAILVGADLRGANLSSANLTGVTLTQTQLDAACGDANTKPPEGLKPPKLCPQVP